MTGYYDPLAAEGSAAVEAQGTEAIPSSTGEVLGAAAGGGLAHAFPTYESLRWLTEQGEMAGARLGGELAAQRGVDISTVPGMLSADDANAQYGIKGRLAWSAPVPAEVAKEQSERMHDSIAREDAIARRESGLLTGGAARLGAGLAGGLPGIVDPLNIAASFIPVVGEARGAIWAARAGLAERPAILAGRAGAGAIQGATGQALLTPLQYGLSRAEGEDMGATDALLNIALGGIFGGGLHTLAGLGRGAGRGIEERTALALDRADPEIREALLRGSIADLAEERPVETPAALLRDPSVIAAGASRILPYERVPQEPERLASFLQRQGGIVDEGGELGANDYARQRPGLVNRAGLSLDEAGLRAWEAGYFPEMTERPTTAELLDRLDSDLKGHPVYSDRDQIAAAEHREALERNGEIDRLAQTHDIPVRGLTQTQFYDQVAQKLGAPAAAAEAERLAASSAARLERASAEVPGDFPPLPGETIEELEHAYRQEAGARDAAPGATGLGERAIVGRAAGADETGAGRGGGGLGARRRGEPGELDPAIERDLSEAAAAEARDPLARLAEESAELDRELAQAKEAGLLPEDSAELEAADEAVRLAEAEARTIEAGGMCLGRNA